MVQTTTALYELICQGQVYPLDVGQAFSQQQFPMLSPGQSDGRVAEVSAHPNDPTMLGLKNLTGQPWTALMPDGSQRQVEPGQSARLADGLLLQLGTVQAQIRAAQAAAAPAAPTPLPAQPAAAPTPLVLDVSGRALSLMPGMQLRATHLPMLSPSQSGAAVAEVIANPNDPSLLGMKNLTSQPWTVSLPDGSQRQVAPGQTARLADGVTFQWSGTPGRVHLASAAQPVAPSPVVNTSDQGQTPPPHPVPKPMPSPSPNQNSTSLGVSKIIPVLSGSNKQGLRAILGPGLLTCLFVALLFTFVGNTTAYDRILGTYMLIAAVYLVSVLCGKQKPWWLLLGVALSCMLLITIFSIFGYFFNTPNNLFGFLIVGLREELIKSLPVFALWWIGMKISGPLGDRIGVKEPVDGILIAAASAAGFTFLETLFQYVPSVVQQAGEAAGVELLVPRMLGDLSGHIAYSGYFGYFIGLSAMMPKHRKRLLLIGFLTAAVLHALWDTFANGLIVMTVLGGISFGFLIGAILKARQLSPTAGGSVVGFRVP